MGVEFDRIRRYYALTEWTPEKQELAGQVIHDLRREGVEDRARISALEAENARLRKVAMRADEEISAINKALGAPGDYGYSSREGKALFSLYKFQAELRAALSVVKED